MLFNLFLILSFITLIYAGCDNGCSGHGECNLLTSECKCHDNWGLGLNHLSSDCSERICPFDIAWVDGANSLGFRHNHAECSNKGLCNRETGECECFPGFEGDACQRTTCPNDCSGHGRCVYMANLRENHESISRVHDESKIHVHTWDEFKSRACECDPGYDGVDCSKRYCEQGTDPLQAIHRGAPQIQYLDVPHNVDEFYLVFTNYLNEKFSSEIIKRSEVTIGNDEFIATKFFKKLPFDFTDEYKVIIDKNQRLKFQFSGSRFSAILPPLELHVDPCFTQDCHRQFSNDLRLTHKVFKFNVNTDDQNLTPSFECGGRGKCNYDTGLCECFAGYNGHACGSVPCLA